MNVRPNARDLSTQVFSAMRNRGYGPLSPGTGLATEITGLIAIKLQEAYDVGFEDGKSFGLHCGQKGDPVVGCEVSIPEDDADLVRALANNALVCVDYTAQQQELINRLVERREALSQQGPELIRLAENLSEWRLVGEVLLTHDTGTPAFDLAISACDKLLKGAPL